MRHVGLLLTPSEEKAVLTLAEKLGKDPGDVAAGLLLWGLSAYIRDNNLNRREYECTRLPSTPS